MAPATPDSARIDPTDRSMPADEMTKVMPIASTPKTDVDRRMLRTLETERKTSDSAAIATQSATSTTSDSSRRAAAPAKLSRQDAGAAGLEVEVMEPSSKGGEAARYQPTGGLDLTSRIAASVLVLVQHGLGQHQRWNVNELRNLLAGKHVLGVFDRLEADQIGQLRLPRR